MSRIAPLVLCLAAAAALPACVGIGGNSNVQRPTTGQELVDLKSALDKGAITQAEYDAKKSEILARKN
jgi:Short C-terminal domain